MGVGEGLYPKPHLPTPNRGAVLRETTLSYKVNSMSAITKFFFRAPYSAPKTWEVFRWWESRRMAYNLAVGAAGVLSLSVVYLAEFLTPGRTPGIPWGGVVVYAILANLFFCLGPIVDAIIMRRWGRNFSEVGPTLFRYGFVFAVGLTLLPVPMVALRVLLGLIF